MKTAFKKELLSFLVKHNDGSEECNSLITRLRSALDYVELNAYSLCPDDLELNREEVKATLRRKLGKKGNEPFNLKDCEEVSLWLADIIEDEFGENLENAICY